MRSNPIGSLTARITAFVVVGPDGTRDLDDSLDVDAVVLPHPIPDRHVPPRQSGTRRHFGEHSHRRGRTNPRVSGYRWSELESPPTSREEQPLLSYGAAVSARPPPGSYTLIHSSWTTSLLWSAESATQSAMWRRNSVDTDSGGFGGHKKSPLRNGRRPFELMDSGSPTMPDPPVR